MIFCKEKKGITLIEVIVGSSVLLVVLLSLSTVLARLLKASFANTDKIQGTFLAEEGLEAIRMIRDGGWTTNINALSSGTDYFIAFDGTSFKATTTASQAYIDNHFYRKFTLSNVYRDASSYDIASSGTLDTNTKLATVSVSWTKSGATTTETLSTYFTNSFGN